MNLLNRRSPSLVDAPPPGEPRISDQRAVADMCVPTLRSAALLRVGTVQIATRTGAAWSVRYSKDDLLIVTNLSDLRQEWCLGEDWRGEDFRLPTELELDALAIDQRSDLQQVRDEDDSLQLAHHHYVPFRPGRHNGIHHPPEHLCQRCGLDVDDPIHQQLSRPQALRLPDHH